MNRITPFLLFLLAAASLAGCGDGSGEPEGPPVEAAADEHGDEHAEGGALTLTPEQVAEAGIETAPVREQPLTVPITVPGRIVPSETGQAMAGAVVAGRLTRLLASEGQAVGRGQALAVIESPEIGSIQGELLHAMATVERTRLELRRQEQLFAEGLSAERLLEQAREEHRIAQADQAVLASQLRAFGAAPASSPSNVSASVTVRAPIAGVISRRIASLGDFVSQSEDLYEIIAPGAVYADAEVPPEQAAALRPGLRTVIVAPGDERYRGEVASVAPGVEAETRTTRIRLRVLNATAALRPETFVSIEFEGEAGRDALVVPTSAVEREGGQAFVYRVAPDGAGAAPHPEGGEHEGEAGAHEEAEHAADEHAEGGVTFERVPVELGDAAGEVVEVRSGLRAGDEVAVDGVFYLRSTRQRGELAEHEH
jgi:cobalt-zinc-cadmium efflux system membrane fusion protein